MIQYVEVAQVNRDLADLNARIAEDSDKAYDHILSAAKQQEQIAVIREDMLNAERQDHFLDNLWHRVLIVVGIGLALL
jgi:DNA-directed RNA polymerase sigma subunit (sigma70/sigma32)